MRPLRRGRTRANVAPMANNLPTTKWGGTAAVNKQNTNRNDSGSGPVAANAQRTTAKPPGRPVQEQRPEWADAKGIQRMFGIGKSTLYRLIDEGKVKSTSLRERGKLRGKRLVSTDSVSTLLESRATGGENQTA
jgi:hypothetical protein